VQLGMSAKCQSRPTHRSSFLFDKQ